MTTFYDLFKDLDDAVNTVQVLFRERNEARKDLIETIVKQELRYYEVNTVTNNRIFNEKCYNLAASKWGEAEAKILFPPFRPRISKKDRLKAERNG